VSEFVYIFDELTGDNANVDWLEVFLDTEMHLRYTNVSKMDISMRVLSLPMDHEFSCTMEQLNSNRRRDRLLDLVLIPDMFEPIDEERLDGDEQMMTS
jgi:hypothetical protein